MKVLQVANAPALAASGVFDAAGSFGVAQRFSLCTWSWLLATVFLIAASFQWWLAGIALGSFFSYIWRRRMSGMNSVRRG